MRTLRCFSNGLLTVPVIALLMQSPIELHFPAATDRPFVRPLNFDRGSTAKPRAISKRDEDHSTEGRDASTPSACLCKSSVLVRYPARNLHSALSLLLPGRRGRGSQHPRSESLFRAALVHGLLNRWSISRHSVRQRTATHDQPDRGLTTSWRIEC